MNIRILLTGLAALALFVLCYTYVSPERDVAYASLTPPVPTATTAAPDRAAAPTQGAGMPWMTWAEAMAAHGKAAKPILVSFYTDWSTWDKRMEKNTFGDPRVIEFVTANFYPVRFDAEQQGPLTFEGKTYKYRKNGSRGVHELAAELLDNRLTYPAIVYLDGDLARLLVSGGYKEAPEVLDEARGVLQQ